MTLEKVLYLLMSALNSVFEMLSGCVISIDGFISISYGELIIGSIIVFFIVKIVAAFAFNN
jgi:hypothetical protein